MGEVKPLRRMAPKSAKDRGRHLRLDALRYDDEVERPAQVDSRAHDRNAAALLAEAPHEGPIDLQLPDRQPLQVGQRRVARAEVIDRQDHAHLFQRVE